MKLKFYRCPHCGKLVIIYDEKGAALTCCGEKMQLLVAGSVDAATEKHLPVVKKCKNKISVTVGSVQHPMTAEHYISHIVLETASGYQVQALSSTSVPEATFLTSSTPVAVYEYCTLHGLWVTKL